MIFKFEGLFFGNRKIKNSPIVLTNRSLLEHEIREGSVLYYLPLELLNASMTSESVVTDLSSLQK